MMIDQTKENLISLKQASKSIPAFDGNSIHMSTIWRWCRKGLKGVNLEYVRCGRRIATSEKALNRFFTELAKLDEKNIAIPLPMAPTSNPDELNKSQASRQKHILDAQDTLKNAGV